jgi:hypothetical protein
MARWNGWLAVGAVAGLLAAGCDGSKSDFKTAKELNTGKAAGGHDDHDHGAGPHGGAIVELGADEYHAEVVVDTKSHALRVYLLGPDAKTATPVAATEVTIKTEDNQSLSLKAKPQDGDVAGKASLFELADEKAVDDLAKAGYLHGSLQMEIDGKPFRGDVDAHFDGSSHDDH